MRRPSTPAARRLALLAALPLIVSACAGGSDAEGPSRPEPEPVRVDDSLGVVRVAPGERIQLRSIVDATGGDADSAELAQLVHAALEVALEDFGGIQGFRVELGGPLDAGCTPQGGRDAASAVLETADVVGVFGPGCEASLITTLSPLSEQGIVVLSATATAPDLTQSPFGEAGVNRFAGFHRTAPNALTEATTAARFAHDELGLLRAVTIEDGSARAAGMSSTFRSVFEGLGGTIVRSSVIAPSADLDAELTAIADTAPDLLFLPLPPDRVLEVLGRWGEVTEGLGVVRVTTSLALQPAVLADPRSEDLYFAGPWLDFADGSSAVTGMGAAQAIERLTSLLGSDEVAGWWAYAYDAMSLLLRAIDDAALVDVDGSLVISRADLQRTLLAPGFRGMTGQVECDTFGDCGSAPSVIRLHEDAATTDPDALAQVYVARD
jgi:branched-chain amino acid transport system substrate-binding protein